MVLFLDSNSESMSKEIQVLPYINIDKIIKMDDFEIHPYDNYTFEYELNKDEKTVLDEFVYSFRETFFKSGQSPRQAKGVGILKYKGTILRTQENSFDINEKLKIIYLLLKLHISYDFFNPSMGYMDTRSLDLFGFNISNNLTNKFGNMAECKNVHSTIPENITGLKYVKFYPLEISFNNIDVMFRLASNGDEILGIDPNITDVTYLYIGIKNNEEYYKKFINIASIHYGLENQKDLFFYFAIIPSVLEVLLYPIKGNKKETAVKYGEKLDLILVKENDLIETDCYKISQKRGLLARTIAVIYDSRNDLLHEGKKSFAKMHVRFQENDLPIYDVFQLLFKYSILNDFVEKGIIPKYDNLYMDDQLSNLIDKVKSDQEFAKIYAS